MKQNADGSVLRVSDVARVVDGFEDRKMKRQMNGEPSISIAINAPETLNIVKLSAAVNNWVAEKNEELGDTAEIFVWFDTADLFFARMELVSSNAVIGLGLVLIILILFLRPAVAFWVTIASRFLLSARSFSCRWPAYRSICFPSSPSFL